MLLSLVFRYVSTRPAGVYFTLLGSQGLRLLGHFYGCGRTGETGWESATCYARKHRDGLLWAFTGENKARQCAWRSMMVFAKKGEFKHKSRIKSPTVYSRDEYTWNHVYIYVYIWYANFHPQTTGLPDTWQVIISWGLRRPRRWKNPPRDVPWDHQCPFDPTACLFTMGTHNLHF